jgi:hypothetical protein
MWGISHLEKPNAVGVLKSVNSVKVTDMGGKCFQVFMSIFEDVVCRFL